MGVFAEIRNGFDYFRKCKCFLDLSKETLCSILVFGNVRFNIVVRINHDKVASRELDVLTPLSDCRQESVEKMEQRISGLSFMCWMDFHNGILCCGFYVPDKFHSLLSSLLSLLRLRRQGLPRPIYIARAITPMAITPLPHCTATMLVSFPAITP